MGTNTTLNLGTVTFNWNIKQIYRAKMFTCRHFIMSWTENSEVPFSPLPQSSFILCLLMDITFHEWLPNWCFLGKCMTTQWTEHTGTWKVLEEEGVALAVETLVKMPTSHTGMADFKSQFCFGFQFSANVNLEKQQWVPAIPVGDMFWVSSYQPDWTQPRLCNR